MKKIKDYVSKLKVGKVQLYQNMAVAPLIGKESKLDYLVFDEALNQGLNVRETGTVGRLDFENNTGKEVLIVQGEYVLGGKQNRMVTRNVYVAKDYNGEIPVNCVQQHRWTPGQVRASFKSSSKRAPRRMCFAASVGSQRDVWNEVDSLCANLQVRSSSANLDDAFEQKGSSLNDYLNNFEYQEGTAGVVAVIQKQGKRVYAVDLFDQSSTMEKHFKKLLESYAIEAVSGGNEIKKQTKKDISEFLSKIKDTKFEEQKPVSLGEDYLLRGKEVMGSALIYENNGVYVSFSTKPENLDTKKSPRTGISRRIRGPTIGGMRFGSSIRGGECDFTGDRSDFQTGFGRKLF